jgi:hypothetical protein
MDARDARDFCSGNRIQPKSELELGHSYTLMNILQEDFRNKQSAMHFECYVDEGVVYAVDLRNSDRDMSEERGQLRKAPN